VTIEELKKEIWAIEDRLMVTIVEAERLEAQDELSDLEQLGLQLVIDVNEAWIRIDTGDDDDGGELRHNSDDDGGDDLDDGAILISYDAHRNDFDNGGFLPVIYINGNMVGSTYAEKFMTRETAYRAAQRIAHAEADRYVGDWDVTILDPGEVI